MMMSGTRRSHSFSLLLPFLYSVIISSSRSFISSCHARSASAHHIFKPSTTIIASSARNDIDNDHHIVKHFISDADNDIAVTSPFYLPPIISSSASFNEEVLSPFPSPYCFYPPFMPGSPPASTNVPSPSIGFGGGGGGGSSYPPPPPPAAASILSPPQSYTTPPATPTNPFTPINPSPPITGLIISPPPSPYTYDQPPASYFPPSPPVFEPPVVYPPPIRPPPPPNTGGPSTALWCVAKPSVPDPIIEEAMNYACGSGADCESLQPSGECFEPDTLFAHASYAFNSYWQRTKEAGGTCDFGGSAILVTVDPSYDGCHFVYY